MLLLYDIGMLITLASLTGNIGDECLKAIWYIGKLDKAYSGYCGI